MGRTAIIMVFVLLIIVGTISIAMHRKQHDAVDALVELTYSKQARYLSNTYVRQALNDLRGFIMDNGGITDNNTNLYFALNNYNNQPPKTDLGDNYTNSSVDLKIIYGDDLLNYGYDPAEIKVNDFFVIATTTVNADDGNVYETSTHVFFEYGYTFKEAPPPPAIAEIPLSVSSSDTMLLNLIFYANHVGLKAFHQSQTSHSFFQFVSQFDSPSNSHINPFPVQKDNFVSDYRNTIVIKGKLPLDLVRIANYATDNQATPQKATYPIRILILDDNSVRLEGSLFSDHPIELYVNGDVTIFIANNAGGRPDVNQRQIHANIYYTGNMINASSIRPANRSGNWQQLSKAEFAARVDYIINEEGGGESKCCGVPTCQCYDKSHSGTCDMEECDYDGEYGYIPLGRFIQGVKSWVEEPIRLKTTP